MRYFALILAASPVVAHEHSIVPLRCEVFVTVQLESCNVRHLYRCAGEPEGDLSRIQYAPDGPTLRATIDYESQWIVTEYLISGSTAYLRPGATDPMSLTELLETGYDSFDFEMIYQSGEIFRYRGHDRLTGETAVIDGTTLLVTEFHNMSVNEAGAVTWEARGTEFIHPEWRTYLSGRTETITPGDRSFSASNPVEFIFPGEPGFMSTEPQYGCE